ncbi:MAG: energy transducer TonB [Bacteroidota bacterium]
MKKIFGFLLTTTLFVLYSFGYQAFSQNRTIVNAEKDSSILMIVETPPEFKGGEKARIDFLVKNITYPIEAREAGIEGVVFITFVIEIDGSISNIKVLRGIGGGCDDEAVRVIRLMPKWTPGKQNGKEVRVQFNMPIKFSFGKKDDDKKNDKLK